MPKKKKVKPAPVVLPPSAEKQLWVVERTDVTDVIDERPRIYVYADRWFDVREVGGMKLGVRGDYGVLFISAVMGDIKYNDALIFEVEYSGTAPNMQKKVVEWHNVTPR